METQSKPLDILKPLLQLEHTWCYFLNIYNPYTDPWSVRISKNIPDYDGPAFHKYYEYQFVYDKYWIAKSQGIHCGDNLKHLIDRKPKYLKFPIFIKPRWGNKSASSKNCFKIKDYDQLSKYTDIEEMMWSEFISEREGMTDFFVQNGKIVHQITYLYSEKQNGVVADEWKYISPYTNPPQNISEWVFNNMKGFTGVCNVQYRGNVIIEVGLRLARGGAYIYSTNNTILIENINTLVDTNRWNYANSNQLDFRPFYAFKCFTNVPIVYLYPQHYLDYLMKYYGCKEFYEYYFEPSGNSGMACFQFMHEDFETGMKVKKLIENRMDFAQISFLLLFLFVLLLYAIKSKYTFWILALVLVLFSTRFINSLFIQYNLLNAQKQSLL